MAWLFAFVVLVALFVVGFVVVVVVLAVGTTVAVASVSNMNIFPVSS